MKPLLMTIAGMPNDNITIRHNQRTTVRSDALPMVGAGFALAAAAVAVKQWKDAVGGWAPRIGYDAVVAVALLFLWSLSQWNLLGCEKMTFTGAEPGMDMWHLAVREPMGLMMRFPSRSSETTFVHSAVR